MKTLILVIVFCTSFSQPSLASGGGTSGGGGETLLRCIKDSITKNIITSFSTAAVDLVSEDCEISQPQANCILFSTFSEGIEIEVSTSFCRSSSSPELLNRL